MMDLHPDIIDAMANAGWTAGMIAAGYRALWTMDRRAPAVPADATGATDATLHATPAVASKRALTSTERSQKRRALRKANESAAAADATPAVACNVASVAPPSLSLKEDLDSSREKESPMQREPVACNVASVALKSAGRSPMPPDWQPWPKNAAFAVGELGERRAANSTVNYREHHEAAGTLMTEPERQARFRRWVRDDKDRITSRQGHLSLPIAGGKSNAAIAVPSSAFVTIRQGTPEAAALEARRGKPIQWGKSGMCTVKATEWPPPEQQEASHG